MFKFFPALLVCLLCMMMSLINPAQASVANGSVIPASVVEPVVQWVARETGTQIPVLPQVIASRSRLIAALAAESNTPIGRPRSGYIPGTVIMDHVYWDTDDALQMSLLVHELVHHAQIFMKNAAWACPDARETLAYTLQNKWLAEHGHEPFVPQSWIDRVASCGTPPVHVAADDQNVTPNG